MTDMSFELRSHPAGSKGGCKKQKIFADVHVSWQQLLFSVKGANNRSINSQASSRGECLIVKREKFPF